MCLVRDQHDGWRRRPSFNQLRPTPGSEIDQRDSKHPTSCPRFRDLKTEPSTDMSPRKSEHGPTGNEQCPAGTVVLVAFHRPKIPLRVLPFVPSPGIVACMSTSETAEGPRSYEPPTITRVGSLSELTQFGKRPNFSDSRPGLDDAESNESGV